MKKGPWTLAEDEILVEYVRRHGEGNWNTVQKNSGLSRCGKSCRLRWANHLRPNLKKGSFSPGEELLILRLHSQLGNKWARMAAHLPGRTDNEIKNYWNTRIKRRQRAGLSLYTSEVQRQAAAFQQQQQQRPTASPPPTPTPYNHKANFPLTLFNLISSFPIPPAPLLTPNPFSGKPHPIKRFRGDDGLFFPPSPSPPLPLYQPVHYNSGKFDLNPVPLSMKTELPSNQFFTELAGSGGGDGSGGLFDAVLQEAQGLGGLHKAPSVAAQAPALESVSNLEDSNRCFGIKKEAEPTDEMIDAVHDDISGLLDMIPAANAMPPTPGPPEWYHSPSGEMSNGPSSVVTDTDDIRLEMQQLTSSLSIAPVEWNTGSCSWYNMPGIC